MANKYAVIRTDLMAGTKQPADLVSVRFYNSDGAEAAVENGVIVELQSLLDGEREIWKAVAATADSDLNDCAILAAPEVMYDERLHNLDQYISYPGKDIRGYIPRSRNMFGLTAEGFVSGAGPAVEGEVGIGADGKLDAAGTGFGKCIAIESDGRYTYHVIKIGKTEGVATTTSTNGAVSG